MERAEVLVSTPIPEGPVVTEALVAGLPVVEYSRNGVSLEIERLWADITRRLGA